MPRNGISKSTEVSENRRFLQKLAEKMKKTDKNRL